MASFNSTPPHNPQPPIQCRASRQSTHPKKLKETWLLDPQSVSRANKEASPGVGDHRIGESKVGPKAGVCDAPAWN